MEKLGRDRCGEIFQDELTENETKLSGARRDDIEHEINYDTNVDSDEADRAMAENRFGLNTAPTDSKK